MNLIYYLKLYFLTLLVFLGIDFIWLGLVAKKFYDLAFVSFQRTIKLGPAFFSYLLIVFGIIFFVLPKAGNDQLKAFIYGSIYGLIVYGVYDLVNLATLKNWLWQMTIIDMLWGGFVCGLLSLISFYFKNLIK